MYASFDRREVLERELEARGEEQDQMLESLGEHFTSI
jgi:hypothetical protein